MRIPMLGIHIVRDKIFEDLETEKQKAVKEQRCLNNGILKNLLQRNANLFFELHPTFAPRLNYHVNGPSLRGLRQKSFEKMIKK